MIDDRLLKTFLDIIQIEGLSAEEQKVAEHLTNRMRACGFTVEQQAAEDVFGNCGNLVCTYNGGGNFALIAHMDTARSTAGVKPQLLADRITSDGTTVLGVDDRAGVAAILHAIEDSIEKRISLKPFTVIFSVQEETTLNGSKYLKIPQGLEMGFIFDSRTRPGTFINSSVGAIAFTITVKGKASHSGIAPEKGVNAIRIASNAIARLPLGRIDAYTTANIGTIKGGSAVNVVPDFVEMIGEVRGPDDADVERIFASFTQIFTEEAARFGGSAHCEYYWDFSPYKHEEGSPLYSKICSVLQNAGLEPVPTMSWGGSDANVFNKRGLPSVNLGIGAENPHSNDEFILYEDLQKAYEIALELIKA